MSGGECGQLWLGGTLRLRAKWWMLAAGVCEDGGEACGSGIRVGLAPAHGTVPPFGRRNRIVALRRVVRFLLLTWQPSLELVHSSRRAPSTLSGIAHGRIARCQLPAASAQHTHRSCGPHFPINLLSDTPLLHLAKSSSTAMLTRALWRHTAAGMCPGDATQQVVEPCVQAKPSLLHGFWSNSSRISGLIRHSVAVQSFPDIPRAL